MKVISGRIVAINTPCRSVRAIVLAAVTCVAAHAEAASVGPSGYTNSFDAQPAAADWATAYSSGVTATISNIAQLDAAVAAVTAGSVTTTLAATNANPPNVATLAVWSTTGYLQTRPTTVGATFLMAKLVNATGYQCDHPYPQL